MTVSKVLSNFAVAKATICNLRKKGNAESKIFHNSNPISKNLLILLSMKMTARGVPPEFAFQFRFRPELAQFLPEFTRV